MDNNNTIPTMLGVKETAQRYGLPVYWVRCAVKQKKVPSVTLGKKILICTETFEAFLRGGVDDEA